MPLHDHFHGDMAKRKRWKGVHTMWIAAIVKELNGGLLPEHYECEPTTPMGVQIELDVATFAGAAAPSNTALLTHTAPTRVAPVTFPDSELPRINIHDNRAEGDRLVAAIELVSPANKDRPATRRAFALKCAGLLAVGVNVVVIDVVTDRTADWHGEVTKLLQGGEPLSWTSETDLAAVSYRPIAYAGSTMLELWAEALYVGDDLPTLPLWLAADLAVPLDLELSYRRMLESLRLG